MHGAISRSQVVSRLQESGEGGGLARDYRVGTGEAAKKMGAELAGVGPRRDAGEWVRAVESEHRHGCAAKSRCVGRAADPRRCNGDIARQVSKVDSLDRRDPLTVLVLDLGSSDVPCRRRKLGVVGNLLDFMQIARDPIYRRQNTRPNRREVEWRQMMALTEATLRRLKEGPTRGPHPMGMCPADEEAVTMRTGYK